MANICETTIAFFTTDTIETLTEFRNMLTNIQTDNIPFTHKYISEKLNLGLTNLEYGDIMDIGEIEHSGTGIGFKVWQNDKWTPQLDLWDSLIEKFFTNDDGCRLVDYVYEAEEPGCGIYINTDEGGDFFPDLYKIDACIPKGLFDTDRKIWCNYKDKSCYSLPAFNKNTENCYYTEYFDSTNSLIDHLEEIIPDIIEWKEIPECCDENEKPTSWSAEVDSPLFGRYIYIDKVSENKYAVVYNCNGTFRPISSESENFSSLQSAKDYAADNPAMIFGNAARYGEIVNSYVKSIQKYLKRKYPDDGYFFYVHEFEAE